jgi:MoaA/NifB/PqqE/SkfB family radical SAM enzyme
MRKVVFKWLEIIAFQRPSGISPRGVCVRRAPPAVAFSGRYFMLSGRTRSDQFRVGEERADELSTAEALDVVGQLAAMGTREVTLIGGEAYLHPGFLEVVAAVKAAGIRATMTTGGRGVTPELAKQVAAAGIYGASVSIDGLEAIHDLVRAVPGSFAAATRALGHLKAAGVRTASNTTLN